MPSEWAARCHNLEKVYRTATATVHALKGVTLELPRSRMTAVAGPSGSGKSSLLRLLAGLDRPTSGTLEVDGVQLHRATGRARRAFRQRRVGYVFQRPSDNFIPHLTVGQHLAMAARSAGEGAHPMEEVAEQLGIGGRLDHLPSALSGGEQQRAAVAQALVRGADIIVADEPTADLDTTSTEILLARLSTLASEGLTIILATHDASVRRAADHVVELDHGSVVSATRRHAPTSARASVRGAAAPLLVTATGLVRSFARGPETVHAVDHADLALREGEVVALVGRSGSGKTTLLDLLGGWERPDAGTITWHGQEAAREPAWEDVSIVPQQLGLIEEFSLRRNVEYPLRLAGVPGADRRVDGLFEKLRLAHLGDRFPGEVSVGEQQRAALARAVARRPRLLLADEPTGHQDRESARAVAVVLSEAASEGTCCLVATHEEHLSAFADRVIRMADGRLSADGGRP
ncbi:MAG TPA: ATP-binding cassette domain-containing protein [Actinomycetota bacterium]